MQSSDELFVLAKTGDRAAFDELLNLLRPKITAFCRGRMGADLRKAVEVNDILQDTSLKAFASIKNVQWQGERALCSWFCGIAQNVIYTYSKRLLRIKPVAADYELADQDGASPSRQARRGERFDRLQKAMDRLTVEQQQVVRLTRIQGLSVRDAASRMDRSEKATYQLLWRAVQKLREAFGDTASFRLPANSNLNSDNHDG